MSNDFDLSKIDIPKFNMPQLDTTTLANLDCTQREINSNMNAIIQANKVEFRKKEQLRQATLETAENTSEMKNDLKIVIHNQNDYIEMLKEQNEYIRQVLNNMFGSSEDSVLIQKEILKIMKESKPTDGMMTDKGLDVIIQMMFNAVQIYLKTKGIFF